MVRIRTRALAVALAAAVTASVVILAPSEIAAAAPEVLPTVAMHVASSHSDNSHWSFRITRDQGWSSTDGTTRYEWFDGRKSRKPHTGATFATTSLGQISVVATFTPKDPVEGEVSTSRTVRWGSPVPSGMEVQNLTIRGGSAYGPRITHPSQRVKVGSYIYMTMAWTLADGFTFDKFRIKHVLQYRDGSRWRNAGAHWGPLGARIPAIAAGHSLRVLVRGSYPGVPSRFVTIRAGRVQR